MFFSTVCMFMEYVIVVLHVKAKLIVLEILNCYFKNCVFFCNSWMASQVFGHSSLPFSFVMSMFQKSQVFQNIAKFVLTGVERL